MISTKIFEVPKNCRPNFGKVAERNLEKLPNKNWKNCRTGIVSFRDV